MIEMRNLSWICSLRFDDCGGVAEEVRESEAEPRGERVAERESKLSRCCENAN